MKWVIYNINRTELPFEFSAEVLFLHAKKTLKIMKNIRMVDSKAGFHFEDFIGNDNREIHSMVKSMEMILFNFIWLHNSGQFDK